MQQYSVCCMVSIFMSMSHEHPLQSRVTQHFAGERNFHIFYQLLNAADQHLLSMHLHIRLVFETDNQ